ncbi:amidohydrolase family protein [Corynebacterium poyangense]|uniref:Amidohydrolase family protein n=1 Tax=Corynebacterium poyangense TaxID=2684405 RepID=A0A7H0SLY9_9CORY|nr:amidohydrolase [Corynebacterium poyangense]QNQ89564.1 amidohydrolase family protein [Corynebacterium poyangense]
MLADLVIKNAHLPLSNPSQPDRDELFDIAVWEGRIIDIAPSGSAMGSQKYFDADGKYAFPGFHDAHAHSVWFGQTLLEIDLSDAQETADVYQQLQEAANTQNDEWIIASGFTPSALADGKVDIVQLDKCCNGRPLVIKHNSGHALTVNSETLERAGVRENCSMEIEGGRIVCDQEGRPTGLLEENAMRSVNNLLQPEPLGYIEKSLVAASDVYIKQGITSVTDAGIAGGWIGHSPMELAAYQRGYRNGNIKHRSQVMITIDALHSIQSHPDDPSGFGLDTGIHSGFGDDFLEIGPTKIFSDGSILGGTAAMEENYCQCGNNRGYFQDDPDLMRKTALSAAANGWSLAIHALGDAAVDFAIDTISEASHRYGRPRIPHRIEHGGVCSDKHIAQIAELGIALVPQPRFIKEFGDHMARLIGPERVFHSYPAARLLKAGAILPGSSDRPVADGNPLLVIQSFVERLTASSNVYAPDDRISAFQALTAYCEGSAAATGSAHKKGKIKSGYLADIVVLDKNPLAVDSSEFGGINVMTTIINGEVRYQA